MSHLPHRYDLSKEKKSYYIKRPFDGAGHILKSASYIKT